MRACVITEGWTVYWDMLLTSPATETHAASSWTSEAVAVVICHHGDRFLLWGCCKQNESVPVLPPCSVPFWFSLSLSLSLKFCNEMNLFRQDVGQPASIPPHPTLILLYILAEMDCSITVTGCPDWVPKPLIKTRNTFRWLINTFSQSGLCRWMCV